MNNNQQFLAIDENKGEFLVSRSAFLDQQILEMEREKVFSKCWLFLGHESEVETPGEYRTRRVGGRSLIFTKDSDGSIRAFHNTCPHRGALLCREREGKTKVFRCFYHAWTFNTKGELVGQPGAEDDGYPEDFNCEGTKNLMAVPRLENYRGFVFINFDPNAISLEEYLAGAKDYLDIIADHSEQGMEVIGGRQEYSIRANWKLLAENSVDGYHGFPTHKTYFDYLASRGLNKEVANGPAIDLGNGHFVIENKGPWGRPVARWMPAWGDAAKPEVAEIYENLVNRFGEERAEQIANVDKNMVIFPNLVIVDIMSLTVRTFNPVSPDYMEVSALALAPKEESAIFRERRLNNFLEFFGPGGFATPDDIEALELVQEGMSTNPEVKWNDISKGMKKAKPTANDEEQMRIFWRQWMSSATFIGGQFGTANDGGFLHSSPSLAGRNGCADNCRK